MHRLRNHTEIPKTEIQIQVHAIEADSATRVYTLPVLVLS